MGTLFTQYTTVVDMGLDKIASRVSTCTMCQLHTTRTNAVPGEGPENASIMLVGEAPGKDEDLQGRPFVGRAGTLLNKMLEKGDLSRTDVYITNAVKCRPPKNRAPKKDEARTCWEHLEEQIISISPKVIAPMGNIPTARFMERYNIPGEPKDLRCKPTTITVSGKTVTLFPVYHPAASLHNPPIRPQVEDSFRQLAQLAKKA